MMSGRIGEFIRRNVLGLVAIFIALTGSAYAATVAPPNSVVSSSIKDGQVKTPDLAASAATAPKLATGAVTTPKLQNAAVTTPKLKALAITNPKLALNAVKSNNVADNSLTGSDVNESTLGTVPSATNADKLDNLDSTSFLGANAAAGGDLTGNYPNPTIAAGKVTTANFAPGATAPVADLATTATRVFNSNQSVSECCTGIQQFFFKNANDEGTTPSHTLYNNDGVTIHGGCHDFGTGLDPVATVDTPAQSMIKGDETSAGAVHGIGASAGVTGQSLTGGDQRGSGQFTVATTGDNVITVLYAFDDASTFGGAEAVCTVNGMAFATSG